MSEVFVTQAFCGSLGLKFYQPFRYNEKEVHLTLKISQDFPTGNTSEHTKRED